MRALLQIISVLAIALGMGLMVGGNVLLPSDRPPANMAQQVRNFTMSEREAQDLRSLPAGLFGFGAGFFTLGMLGLQVPWGNAMIYGRWSSGRASVGDVLADPPPMSSK